MRVLVVGGTGRTGRRVVEAATAAGHTAVAMGRSATPPGRAADILDPPDGFLDGFFAVVTTLSISRTSRSPFARLTGPPDLHQRSTQGILDAMKRSGVRRLIKVSAQGVGDSAPRTGLGFRALVAVSNVRHAFADHAAADTRVQNSATDWTIVRPPRLIDGPATGRVRAGEDLRTTSFSTITTGDVAAWIVAALDDPTWHRRCVTLV